MNLKLFGMIKNVKTLDAIVNKMNTARLTTLEGELLEYKRMVDGRSLSKEIVAFANTRGGKIIIGVDDDGTVTGVHQMTVDDLSNMARDNCDPPLAPKIDMKDHDGKKVITVTVDPGQDTPYRTQSGKYYVRVGATSRLASLQEIIDLLIRGPHRGTILLKARMPQLQTQISSSMKAGATFDQALIGIAELTELVVNTAGESTKMKVADIVGELLEIPCSNDKVVLDLLLILAALTSIDLARDPCARPPSQDLVGQTIKILKQALFYVTIDSKVTDQTIYIMAVLHMVGMACAWANYTGQFCEVLDVVNLHKGRDRKLTNLCRDTAKRLEKCAEEKHVGSPRRFGMLIEPFEKYAYPARRLGMLIDLFGKQRGFI